jgi:hypothetical protein
MVGYARRTSDARSNHRGRANPPYKPPLLKKAPHGFLRGADPNPASDL